MSRYGLALQFDTDGPEFARGVEMGRLWEMMRRIPEAFDYVIHDSNVEMALRAADALGRAIASTDQSWGQGVENHEYVHLEIAAR